MKAQELRQKLREEITTCKAHSTPNKWIREYQKEYWHSIDETEKAIMQAFQNYLTSLELPARKDTGAGLSDTMYGIENSAYNKGVSDCRAKLTAAAEQLNQSQEKKQ